MHRAKYRMIGLTLLTGAALAAGCGGDGGGGTSGGNTGTGTTGIATNGVTSVTNNVNTATSNGTTTAGTGTTTGTTGAGGSGGGGCEDTPPTGTTGGAGEGGAAGASGEELEEGWNFVNEVEVGEWSIVACAEDATNCVDADDASIDFSCGVMQVEIEWPEAANTAAARFQVQNVVSETMLRDLTGKVLYARVRMTSEKVDPGGYDFDLIAQDFIVDGDDGNDWKWFSTCYDGSGACPDNPSGETYDPDVWIPLTLPMRADLAPADFAFDGVRKFALQISTKYWDLSEDQEFAYDAAPATFEIDYVAW